MDDFEKRLQELPLRAPSSELRSRIFDRPQIRRVRLRSAMPRIPLAWAAALAIIAGAMGYGAARLMETEPRTVLVPGPATVRVEIVETQTAQPLFDFTGTSADFLSGKCAVRLETNGEV